MTVRSKQAFQAAFFRKAGPNAATFRKILDFFPDAGLCIIDAHDCGFYDQSHFIRTFKRLRRQTPAQYRRAHFTA